MRCALETTEENFWNASCALCRIRTVHVGAHVYLRCIPIRERQLGSAKSPESSVITSPLISLSAPSIRLRTGISTDE